MFTRGTWGQLPADQLDDFVVALRPSIDAISACAGYQGVAALANRESGAAIVVTYWESEAAMLASEEVAAGTRASITSRLPNLTVTDVDRLEIALQERVAPPRTHTIARVTDVRIPPDTLGTFVGVLRDRWIPVGKIQPGFRACLVTINRTTGRALVATIWESAAELEAAEAALAPVREQVRVAIGPHTPTVQRYEVILAEIKLPAAA